MKKYLKKTLNLFYSVLILMLFFFCEINGQTKLYSDTPVSDFGNTNHIGSANTSRNIAVDSNGYIYVVYGTESSVRIAKSIDGGQSFLPSILISNTLFVDPEININENDIIYIAWTENAGIFFTSSTDSGVSFTNPRLISDNIAGGVHMSSYGNNVYLIDQLGNKLISNDNNGIGTFNELKTNVNMVYADVLVDQNGVVYTPMDNPELLLFQSTDQGKTITNTLINPIGSVYFSSYALSDGPCGTFIFVGGGKTPPSNTLGYKINAKTGESTEIKLGNNSITSEGRTLYADNKGTLIDGYRIANGNLLISISSDQGNNFNVPILVANGKSHNISRSTKTNHIVITYEKNGEIFLSVYTDVVKNIEITSNKSLSLCSGQNFDIEFELNGVFSSNTLFTVSLSDENGDFSNATQIGSTNTNTNGNINCTLPDDLPTSSNYRIQIESLANCIQSNTINLGIINTGISGNFEVCIGQTSQLTGVGSPIDNNPWTSSNPNVATVDTNGFVTSLSFGTTTITYYSKSGCSKEITFEVFDLPEINKNVNLNQCDNDSDGFSSFNLNEVNQKIVENSENFIFTFYKNKTSAETNTNPIPNATSYKNEVVSNDKIWVRIENKSGCFKLSEVSLNVSTTQIPVNFSKSYNKCDNDSNTTDGIATFDFSDVENDIINLFPINQQLEITFYRNEEDALAELNKINDITNYQNSDSPNQQNIYVRVDSKVDNSCLGLGAHISLNVEKTPVANPVILNPECDNDRDGLFAFDTSTIQNTIIGSQNNVSVSYFDSNGTPLSSPLPNPFNTASQTITARIENINSLDNDGKCFDETEINFVVNTVPIANTIAPQEECDDDFDGIVAFDTSSIETTIIGTQTGLIVKYFDENDTPLPSPLPNPFVTASQTIKVRLENPIFDVCFEETTVDFIVNQKPDFTLISDDIICMNNTPKLELNIDNPTGNYTYTWRDENDVIVGNEANIAVFKGGTYSAIATSDKGCTSNEKSIFIKESAISTININDIEVQDDSENNFIKINTANLGLGDYEFRLLDNDAHIIYDYQDASLFENLAGGVYLLELNDKNNCGSITFKIALISFPKYFTPNVDGINDYWQIKGIDNSFYKSGIIYIFNRYGKQITKFTIEDVGWDGTYNGRVLNANDYWFRVVLINENDVVKIRTGNFSLIR
jgi:gliding motility-associated-like protein